MRGWEKGKMGDSNVWIHLKRGGFLDGFYISPIHERQLVKSYTRTVAVAIAAQHISKFLRPILSYPPCCVYMISDTGKLSGSLTLDYICLLRQSKEYSRPMAK